MGYLSPEFLSSDWIGRLEKQEKILEGFSAVFDCK
jgi:hypothetical protein